MSPIGCIADDYTGATDAASGFRREGLRTVLVFGPPQPGRGLPDCDAVVVALKSRNLAPGDAVELSLRAQRWLASHGVERTYFKYCSTFDSSDTGNIGPVADALLDGSGSRFTVVCPASPEHGRTVYQGHLFVGRQPLSESSMRHHPLTPMTDSDLVRLMGRQTPHSVDLVPHEVVRRGADAVEAAFDDLAVGGVRYAVTDAISDDDLHAIATAARSLPVVTGAAGLARLVGSVTLGQRDGSAAESVALPDGPAVILAGSCSATTLDQVARARSRFPSFRLDPQTAADPASLRQTALTWLDRHLGDAPVMLYSSAPPEERSSGPVAQTLEQTMGALAASAVERGARRLVVAGGETSGAVIDALGVDSVIVASEEDRGVPWTITADEPRLGLMLKSGNFGRPDLLVRAAETA